ncbi:hypothetical protein SDC9_128719 [bioreactor metagenome]|uniref:Uncharacterized protein n=1 Tax=bioreactor metagenome TaxID=1076179 RepID=A0A645CYJ5_9ZZZZ
MRTSNPLFGDCIIAPANIFVNRDDAIIFGPRFFMIIYRYKCDYDQQEILCVRINDKTPVFAYSQGRFKLKKT